MFAVQENLLRTGADPRTTEMVDTMNANNKAIKAAEAEANKFRRQIELINREIEKDQRVIEEKYTRPIEDMTEEINDLNRELEMNPLFGDRAIETLNKENTMLSNDLSLISNAAEKINEKYDEQAEALQKVSDINENITRQQEGQLDLADALTQGDISAAARAMQASRADAASMFQGTVSDALDQSRQNEIDNLRGPESGLTQKEIQERQFEISQKIYDMETDPARLAILEQIRVKQDAIYDLEELREKALIKIREKEDAIYKIQKDQLTPLEDKIEDLTYQNALIQEAIDKLVEETTVLDKTKLEWERIKARIDANALASKNLDGELGALLASTSAIDAKWADILAKLAEYNGTPQGVIDAQGKIEENAADSEALDSASQALDAANAAVDNADAALTAAYNTGQWARFAELQRALAAANEALASAQGDYDSAVAKINNPGSGSDEDTSGGGATGGGGGGGRFGVMAMSSGGLVKPKYFAMGGYARGTDTVPAMLTPGEFIMSKYAVDSYGLNNMKSLNNGTFSGDSVYNYSVSVNVESDANPDQIAQAVMRQIKQVDSQRIRGNRL
jgi:DNA repair exonuclease SbcCD ATPase subunit